MSVSLRYVSSVKGSETLETNVPAATSPVIVHSGFDTSSTLNATSTPPVSLVAALDGTMTAGALTLDLTALTGTNGATVDGTGLRVQAIKVKTASANTGTYTIVEGAANGYDGFGASFSLELGIDAEATILTADNGTNIGAANKTLDISGTGAETAEIIIFMG